MVWGWVLFRAQDAAQAMAFWAGMFTGWTPAELLEAVQLPGTLFLAQLALALAVYRLLPERWPKERPNSAATGLFYMVLLTAVAWAGLVVSGQQSAFLYFQF